MIEYKILDSNDTDEIITLDQIRIEAFKLKENSSYFIDNIKNGKMIGIEMIVNNTIVGGAYLFISPNTHSITIERIFILEQYRHNDFASNLIEYIISQRDYFENKYNITISSIMAEPSNDSLIEFYKSNGFKGPNTLGNMKRHLDYEITNNIKK